MTRWTLVVLALASCHKDSVATHAAQTKENDALWALAPASAKAGVVVSPRAVAMIEHAWTDIRHFMHAATDLADVAAFVDAGLKKELGTANPTLADLGLAADKGAAVFVVDDGKAVAVLPVIDRDKFRAAFHLKHTGDVDSNGDMTCKPTKDLYACAKPVELIDELGNGKLPVDKLAQRGDIEMVATAPVPIAVTVELSRGAITVRGDAGGVPPQLQTALADGTTPRADPDHTSGFAVIPAASLQGVVPPIPLGAGLTARDILSAFSGAITLWVPAGTFGLDLRAPLAKPDMIRPFIDSCDKLGPLAAAGATVSQGTCHVTIPNTQVSVDVWIDASTLRIATSKSMPEGKSVAMSEVGAEIAKGRWAFAFWGHGALSSTPVSLPSGVKVLPEVGYGLRAISMLSEMGMGVRFEGDKAHFVGTFRTVFANPDDVVDKLAAIAPLDLIAGGQLEAVAKASPNSPLAGDVASGPGGILGEVSVIGILAAVAIPAFMDYMKKSKRPESVMTLKAIAHAMLDYDISHGGFPVGDVAPGPSCCLEPTGKCEPPSDPVWKQLDVPFASRTMFRYGYHSDGKTAEIIAVGDLDCDGIEITYKQKIDRSSGTAIIRDVELPTNPD